MVIGGYSLEKLFDSITVKHYESGWSFLVIATFPTSFQPMSMTLFFNRS